MNPSNVFVSKITLPYCMMTKTSTKKNIQFLCDYRLVLATFLKRHNFFQRFFFSLSNFIFANTYRIWIDSLTKPQYWTLLFRGVYYTARNLQINAHKHTKKKRLLQSTLTRYIFIHYILLSVWFLCCCCCCFYFTLLVLFHCLCWCLIS